MYYVIRERYRADKVENTNSTVNNNYSKIRQVNAYITTNATTGRKEDVTDTHLVQKGLAAVRAGCEKSLATSAARAGTGGQLQPENETTTPKEPGHHRLLLRQQEEGLDFC